MANKYCFLYVGCADCTVLQLNDKLVMVDCHQGDTSDGQEDILDWLPSDSIDVMILTHQNYDHFDGDSHTSPTAMSLSKRVCMPSYYVGHRAVEKLCAAE